MLTNIIYFFLDLYRLCNEPARENDAYQMHCNFSQMLLKDHFQSTQMAEHSLIQWTGGDLPELPGPAAPLALAAPPAPPDHQPSYSGT